jgi:hypothetical protein
MNERIKELSLQASDSIPDDVSAEHAMYLFQKTFAELIVRECVRYFNEDYQRDFDTLWREDLSKGIREHFGVE